MLRKTIETKTGVNATIWDLIRVEWNKNGETLVALYGYIDSEHTENEPIDSRVINLGNHSYWYLSDIYDKIVESKQELVTPEIPEVLEVLDDEGNIIVPHQDAIPAVYRELNEFAGATKV